VLVVLFYGVPGAVRKEKWYFWLEHGRKSGALYVFFSGWDNKVPSDFG